MYRKHHLFQVVDIERDINKALAGAGGELVYKTLTGLKADLTVESKPVLLQNETNGNETDNDDERKCCLFALAKQIYLMTKC